MSQFDKLPPDVMRKILEMADKAIEPKNPDDKGFNRDRRRKNKKPDAPQPKEHRLFDCLCIHYGLPVPVHEYPFAKEIGRKWRFDHLFSGWLAVCVVKTIEMVDRQLLNDAVILDYAVLLLTREELEDGSGFRMIGLALGNGRC